MWYFICWVLILIIKHLMALLIKRAAVRCFEGMSKILYVFISIFYKKTITYERSFILYNYFFFTFVYIILVKNTSKILL
jgi:hypothetical protein